MKENSKEVLIANADVLAIIFLVRSIGWNSIREQSIQRIMYLSKVLYSFANEFEKNPFHIYHFTASISGPYSDLVASSIVYLRSNEFVEDNDGDVKIIDEEILDNITNEEDKLTWLKTIVYILGLYGENRIFGFTINDPLYKDAVHRNEPKELDTSPDSVTIKVLNDFKKAFEETIEDVSSISKNEYLELYFEYIFSKIVKREGYE